MAPANFFQSGMSKKSNNWRGVGLLPGSYFTRLKRGAEKRGLPFLVSKEFLWLAFLKQEEKCALTGLPLFMVPSHEIPYELWKYAASVDRINPNVGYEEGNVRWVSRTVNFMRRDFTDARFMTLAEAIYSHQFLGKSIYDQVSLELPSDEHTSPTTPRKRLEFRPQAVQKDFSGSKFGKIIIVRYVGHSKTVSYWLCRCSCGTEFISNLGNVRIGKTKSCGCGRHVSGDKNPLWTGSKDVSGDFMSKLRRDATRRDIICDLDAEEIQKIFDAQDRRCYFTGWPLHFRTVEHPTRTASLDRLNSNDSYNIENVVWVHKDVNMMKWMLDKIEFLNLIGLIVKNRWRENHLVAPVPRWAGAEGDDEIWSSLAELDE